LRRDGINEYTLDADVMEMIREKAGALFTIEIRVKTTGLTDLTSIG
jgi:hypothetical protein